MTDLPPLDADMFASSASLWFFSFFFASTSGGTCSCAAADSSLAPVELKRMYRGQSGPKSLAAFTSTPEER